MHGPGTIYHPVYPVRPIVVRDGVAASLGPFRKRRWRKNRNQGLALWEQAGIKFSVIEVAPITFVGLGEPDWPIAGSESYAPIQSGTIALGRSTYTPPAPKYWQTAWASVTDAGVAWFHLERIRSSEKMGAITNALYRVICHEVGHCLGLAHGGKGIMGGGAMEPDAHDLDSVRRYYLP